MDPITGTPVHIPGPVSGPRPIPTAGANASPEWLKVMVALLILGIAVEGVYAISPGASYGLVAIILYALAVSGGRVSKVNDFLSRIGFVARGN